MAPDKFNILPEEKRVLIWNEYCESINNLDAQIHPLTVESFNEVMGGLSPWKIVDAMPANGDEFDLYYNNWFQYDEYLKSAKDANQLMEYDEDFIEFMKKL